MTTTPNRSRQDLRITWHALNALRDNHRLTPEDRQAIDRVFNIITIRWLELRNHDQDTHP